MRNRFGGTSTDWVFTPVLSGSAVVPSLASEPVTFWSSKTGGTQYTDLLVNGAAASTVVTTGTGQLPIFYGPDGVTELWADAGSERVLLTTNANAASTAWLDESAVVGDLLIATLAARQTRPIRIVFAGSSTTVGLNATQPMHRWVNRFTARLQSAFPSGLPGGETEVVTAAVGAASPSRLPGIHGYNGGAGGTYANSYMSAGLLGHIGTLDPQIVVHMIGANDYYLGVTPADYKAALITALTSIDGVAPDVLHVIVSTYPRPDVATPAYPWSDYGVAMREVADQWADRGRFVDLTGAYSRAGVPGADPLDLISADNIHQTDAGHEMMAARVAAGLAVPVTPRDVDWILTDTGERSDGGLDQADQGNPWRVQSGTWTRSGGTITQTTGGTALVDAGTDQVDVRAVVRVAASEIPGILARASDDSNRLGLFLNRANGTVDFYRMKAGVNTLLTFAAFASVVNRDYTLRLVVDGDQVSGYVDGARLVTWTLDATDLAAFAGRTMVGVRCSTPGGKFSRFGVRRVGDRDPAPRDAPTTTRFVGAQTHTPFVVPAGAQSLFIRSQNPGNGGGSGRRGAAGTVRCGGGGGSAGSFSETRVAAASLPRTLYITVGTPGTGGAGVATDDTNGSAGTAATVNAVKTDTSATTAANTLMLTSSGVGGSGGTAASGTGGTAGAGRWIPSPGAAASTTGGVGGNGSAAGSCPGSGGAGGGLDAANTNRAGGTGGYPAGVHVTQVAGGTAGGGAGNVGVGPIGDVLDSAGGGSGGGSNSAGPGGAGGNGGPYGGGGGGGGASVNGQLSGKGGDGGRGFVEISVIY